MAHSDPAICFFLAIHCQLDSFNPSTIGDELLTVRFPDPKENQVIIPRTTKLTFSISLSGTGDVENGVKLMAIVATSDFTENCLIKKKIISDSI